MSVNLPLDQMTTEEKLQAMEALWADLTRNEERFESPGWHKQVLQEREQRIESGQESLIDWEVAKKQLREGLCNSQIFL
jgi:hypothetical protein